jgi:hypothetical protein
VKLTRIYSQTPLPTKWAGVCARQFGDHADAIKVNTVEGAVG